MKFTSVHAAALMTVAVAFAGQAAAQSTAAPAAPAAPAAAPAPAASPLSFNIGLTTNYKFRGQDQHLTRKSQVKPALQGGFDYADPSGFYVGNWNSTVSFRDADNNKANLEIDLYGGYKFNYGDIGFDVGALTYIYPSANKANTTELYAAASYGPATIKYSSTVSKGYFGVGVFNGDGRRTGYLNLALSQEVTPKITLKASIGQTMFRSVVNDAGVPDYTDYNVGAVYDFGDGLTLLGAIQGGTKKGSFQYSPNGTDTRSANRTTLLFTLSKAL